MLRNKSRKHPYLVLSVLSVMLAAFIYVAWCMLPTGRFAGNNDDLILTAGTGDGVTVTVTGSADLFPEGDLKLAVKEAPRSAIPGRLFDISITDGEKEIEPKGAVTVTFRGILDGNEGAAASILHIDDENGTVDDMGAWKDEDGTLVMRTDHFSLFEVLVETDNSLTLDDVLRGLGIANQFAVFANSMDAMTHMEGMIAVQNVNLGNGYILDLGGTGGGYWGNNKPNKITLRVTKDVEGTDTTEAYYFGIYDKNGNQVGNIEHIDGNGSFTCELPYTDDDTYYVREVLWDGKNWNILEDGDGGDGFTVSYDSYNLSGNMGTMNRSSYIERFVSDTPVSSMTFNKNSVLYVGEEYKIIHGDYPNTGLNPNEYGVLPKDGKPKVNQVNIMQGDETNLKIASVIKWEEMFDQLSGFSEELSTYPTNYTHGENKDKTPGVKVMNLAPVRDTDGIGRITDDVIKNAAQKPNDFHKKDHGVFDIRDDQYLIVNVDCAGFETVAVPSVCIKGSNPGDFKPTNGRLLWNFVNGGECYTGKVTMEGNTAGTLLAPKGTVDQTGLLNGAIIADHVIRGGSEIHQISFRQSGYMQTTVTNTYQNQDQRTSIKVNKVWNDNENSDGKRPDSVTVWLQADGVNIRSIVLKKDQSWEGIFTDLPVCGADGTAPIKYTVVEDPVPNYTPTYSEPVPSGEMQSGGAGGAAASQTITVTNTPTKPGDNLNTVKVNVNKIWAGDAGNTNTRPESLTFFLYKNGEPTGISITLTASDDWHGTFGVFPATEDGKPVKYTVVEQSEIDGYEFQYTQYEEIINESGADSKLDPDLMELWVPVTELESGEDYLAIDSRNQPGKQDLLRAEAWQTDNILKASVTVAEGEMKDTAGNTYKNYILMYNSDGSSYALSWEARSAGSGFALYSNVLPMWSDDAGHSCFGYLQANKNKWKVLKQPVDSGTSGAVFTPDGNGRFTTDEGGSVYLYKKVALSPESLPESFIQTDLTANVINRYKGDLPKPPPVIRTSLRIEKRWSDTDAAGRPDSVTMQILANGISTGQQVILTAANGWKATVTGLDIKDADGKPITYSVLELGSGYVASVGNTTTSDEAYWVMVNEFEDGGTYILTTTTETGDVFADEAHSKKGTHDWSTSKIHVTDEDVELGGQIYEQYISDEEAQQHKAMQWVAGDVGEKTGNQVGKRHCFTLQNVDCKKYFSTVGGTPSLKDKPGDPSTYIYYGLTRLDLDGKPIHDKSHTPTNNPESEWNFLIGGMNDYVLLNKNGKCTTEAASGGTAQTFYLYKRVEVPFQDVVVTNTKSEVLELKITKRWTTNGGAPLELPGIPYVTVQLYANGVPTGQKLQLTAEGSWTGTFTNLPKKDVMGKDITYTVDETPVPGFTVTVGAAAAPDTGFIITNKKDKEFILPDAGGMGTWGHICIGLLMMIASAWCYVKKRD